MTDAARTLPNLPHYRCHKIVEAAQIIGINNTFLELRDAGTIEVSTRWLEKHQPEVGGYYVCYEDDYRSYSPRQAFEQGYTRLGVEGERVADFGGVNRATEALPRPMSSDEQKVREALRAEAWGPISKADEPVKFPPTPVDERAARIREARLDLPGSVPGGPVMGEGPDSPFYRAFHPKPGDPERRRSVYYANGRRVRLRKIVGAACVHENQDPRKPGPIKVFFEGGSWEGLHGTLAEFVGAYWVESSSGRCYVISEGVKWDLFDACEPQSQRPPGIDGNIVGAVRRDLFNLETQLKALGEFVGAMKDALR